MEKLEKNQRIALRNIKNYYNGKLVVKYNLEYLDISNGIDWSHKTENNSRTYQVYLHSLPFIQDFLTAGRIERKSEYFKEAKNIIVDWYTREENESQKWNEHAVSSRIKNIIDFQQAEHKFKLNKRMFNQIVNEHCQFLNDEKHYKRNNHGLMMDISLIYSASVLGDENLRKIYLEKALYRVRFAFYRDFSRKGIHLENSPEYHRLTLALYRKLKDALARHNVKVDNDINILVENANNYKRYMVKPDLTYPLIGDTGRIQEKNIKKIYKDFVDYEAGMVVINKPNKNKPKESAFLTFKSGYQSKTHKHFDDLSVTYYNFGQDILVDSGKYSYNQQDSKRNFIVSSKAHNTVLIKDKEYILSEPLRDQQKLKISKYIKEKDYKAITGINNLYPETAITRHTIFTNDDVLFIIDGISSKNTEIVQQNFNLSRDAVIEKETDSKYNISIDNHIYSLETFKVRDKTAGSNVEKGYYSEKFSEIQVNHRIVFEIESDRMIFVTALYRKDLVNINKVRLSNNILSYICNNEDRTIRY